MSSNVLQKIGMKSPCQTLSTCPHVERYSGVDMTSKISYVFKKFELDGVFTVYIQIKFL